MAQIKPNLMFSPGPTMVSEKSLKILSEMGPHHRSESFKKDFNTVLALLKRLFQTEQGHVFCLTSSGTGAMEASTVNLLEPGSKALYYNAGKFGERWGEMARCFQIECDEIQQAWGHEFDLHVFEQKLKSQKYEAFLIQACETSTATRQPLKEISVLLQKHQPDCLFIVDGITAVGAYDVSMQGLGIDALCLGSQKALGLSTGLSFVGFSTQALKRMAEIKTPRFYFDLSAEKKANDINTTNFSTPVSQILSLKFKLESIFENGLEKYFQKTQSLQKITLQFLSDLGCEVFSQSPSPSLSAFHLPKHQNVGDFQKRLLSDGLYLAGGQGEYKSKILRWGHMGDISIQAQCQAFEIFAQHFSDLTALSASDMVSKDTIQKVLKETCEKLQKQKVIDECLP